MASWNPRADEIFRAAVKIDAPEQRCAFLVQACGDDDGLRAAVDGLLAADSELGPLDRPALAIDSTADLLTKSASETEHPDSASGHSAQVSSPGIPGYQLLGELGRGGMGVVYKARQIQLDRLMELKMIRAGGFAGEAELARFRTEAQAIARLRHRCCPSRSAHILLTGFLLMANPSSR